MEEEFYISEGELTTSMKAIRFYFHRVSPITPRIATRLFWHFFTQPRPRKFSKVDESFYRETSSEELVSKKYKASFKLHKRGRGAKKVLVLHGWEGRSSDFMKLARGLEEEATVYMVDFPGHGKSPKSRAHLPLFVDTINTVLDHLKEIDVVAGHSLGAASLAMSIGQRDFEARIHNLVFLGLHPEPSQFFLQYKRVTKVNENVFNRCVRLAEKKTGVSLLDYSCYNFIEEYGKYSIHFVHDAFDKIIKVDRVEKLADMLENASVFKGDHGGHFRHFKDHEVVDYIRGLIL